MISLRNQVDELREAIKREDTEVQDQIKEQRKELERLEKEAGEVMGHGGKLKMRVDELKREVREAN